MFNFVNSRFFRVYIVPGAVFQSVMVGGGYGTGREIVEYFTSYGFLGGILGLLIAFIVVATVLALTYETARKFRVYDYRNFFKGLLGRGWIVFELLLILQFLLVLAVLASAAGNILRDNFGLPYSVGLAIMLVVVGLLTYFGREIIAKVLTLWSFLLYAVIIGFLIAVFRGQWDQLVSVVGSTEIRPGWWQSGFKYAAYNVAAAPLLLYVARNFESRREAIGSGVAASAIAIIPAFLFQIALSSSYPAVLPQPIPVYWVMETLGATVLLAVYSVMLLGTFIETGAGMLQGINERIDAYLLERRGWGLSQEAHAALAVVAIVVSAVLSQWGITNLIASGYGTMAWAFFVIYVIPLVTIGVYHLYQHGDNDDINFRTTNLEKFR